MERQAKYQRITSLRNRLPRCTQRALAAFIAESKRGDLPDITSRQDIRDARDAIVSSVTPYGPLIQDIKLRGTQNNDVLVKVVNPLAMMYLAAQKKHFGSVLKSAASSHMCSCAHPWKLCLYADEAKPGNRKKQDNRRALQNIYFSLLEFGAAALAKEDLWLVAGTVKANVVLGVEAGMSQLIGGILKLFFSSTGHNVEKAGMTLLLHDGTTMRLFLKLSCILGDESALHQIWMCKGSSGIRCCLECPFIAGRSWTAAAHIADGARLKRFHDVCTIQECERHSKQSVLAIIDGLGADKLVLGKGKFEEKQTVLGFVHNASSILCDPELREIIDPSSQNTYDWVHNVCQGCWQITMWHVLRELSTVKPEKPGSGCFQFRHIHEYLQNWTWPRRIGDKARLGADLFSPKRAKSHMAASTIKATISEVLTVHDIIAHWLRAVVLPSGLYDDECACYISLSTLINVLWQCAKLHISAELVAEATSAFLHSFTSAFGTDPWVWKFHAILHHALYVRRYGWSPHTIMVERKHKWILSIAEDMHNDKASDNVLREVLARQLWNLENASFLDMTIGLVNPHKPSRRLRAFLSSSLSFPEEVFLTSSQARYSEFEVCSKGDVVAIKDGVAWFPAQVYFHASAHDVAFAAVLQFVLHERHASFNIWQKGETAFF